MALKHTDSEITDTRQTNTHEKQVNNQVARTSSSFNCIPFNQSISQPVDSHSDPLHTHLSTYSSCPISYKSRNQEIIPHPPIPPSIDKKASEVNAHCGSYNTSSTIADDCLSRSIEIQFLDPVTINHTQHKDVADYYQGRPNSASPLGEGLEILPR